MLPPPPRSTLFPYTTLFRSVVGVLPDVEAKHREFSLHQRAVLIRGGINVQLARMVLHRSEEHTSELQSLTNLVCRLLLEKKKKKIKIQHDIEIHNKKIKTTI